MKKKNGFRETATENFMGIPVMCCPRWKALVDRVKVIPRNANEVYGEDTYLCKAIENAIKELIGNYCPCCGKKL